MWYRCGYETETGEAVSGEGERKGKKGKETGKKIREEGREMETRTRSAMYRHCKLSQTFKSF